MTVEACTVIRLRCDGVGSSGECAAATEVRNASFDALALVVRHAREAGWRVQAHDGPGGMAVRSLCPDCLAGEVSG